jgi:hypothetical protein
MNRVRNIPVTAAIVLALAGPLAAAEPAPQRRQEFVPTRDVDIVYDVVRPQRQQQKSWERIRWLAGDRLERVDSPDRSATVFDRNRNEVTLLNPATRTYRKLEGESRRPTEPEPGTKLQRGSQSVIAGVPCTDWSWSEEVEMHTVCATADGVPLRHEVDGQIVMQARSVKYGPQKAELFQIPSSYAPALAPEGGPAAP